MWLKTAFPNAYLSRMNLTWISAWCAIRLIEYTKMTKKDGMDGGSFKLHMMTGGILMTTWKYGFPYNWFYRRTLLKFKRGVLIQHIIDKFSHQHVLIWEPFNYLPNVDKLKVMLTSTIIRTPMATFGKLLFLSLLLRQSFYD